MMPLPPNASSRSSFSSSSLSTIPSGADDPGFKLRYHHIAMTKSRGVKEMSGTRIEALYARKISASPWPPLSLSRDRLGLSPLLGVLEHLPGGVEKPSFSLSLS